MKEATFDPARELTLYFRCNRAGSKNFVFTYSDGSAYSFIYDELELNIYKNQGDKKKLISLTHISGLTLSSNAVTATVTKALTNIPEGEYYWELYRTDLEKTWLTGDAIFHNGKFDGVTTDSTSIVVTEDGDDINITVNEASGSGSLTLANLGTTLQTADADIPLDADTFNFYDAVAAVLRKVTWANIKTTLKTYFDPFYWKATGTTTITGNVTITGDNKQIDEYSTTAGGAPQSSRTLYKNASTLDSENAAGHTAQVGADNAVAETSAYLYANNSTDEIEFILKSTNSAVIRSTIAGFQGIKEEADYSANYAALSLVNKTYADLKVLKINTAVALVDGATMDLTATKHTLATSSATRTFTISYTGDDITLEVTLSTTASTFTFPATSLCVSEGTASGDNTCALAGVSGDKYMIAIKKVGSAYYVIAKNFGQ